MNRAVRLAVAGIGTGLLALSCFTGDAFSCTTFVLRQGDHIAFGRNYDWNIDYGLVFVNQAGLRKAPLYPQPTSLSWSAKYGSVTFNQYGKEAPMDGMNQAGLVVAQMWLDGTTYPVADSRPGIGALPWIQYQLDNCATVEEVVRTDAIIRIYPGNSPLHFLVADRAGDAAVIEFLSGSMVVHRGNDLPVRVLTNNSYDDSVANLRQYAGFGGNAPIPSSSGSLSRFVRVADWIARFGAQDPTPITDYAFAILSSAAQTSTRWTIVYDIHSAALDYLCRNTSKMLDINIAAGGDVMALLQPYTRLANRDLIYRSYRGTDSTRSTPDSVIDALAALPDSFICCRPEPWMDKTRTRPPIQVRKKW
jgi:hypothetical protein